MVMITNPQSQMLMLMLMLTLDMATLRVLEMVTKMAMAMVMMMMSMDIWDGDGDYVDYGDNAFGNSVHQRRQGKKTRAWSCTLYLILHLKNWCLLIVTHAEMAMSSSYTERILGLSDG